MPKRISDMAFFKNKKKQRLENHVLDNESLGNFRPVSKPIKTLQSHESMLLVLRRTA